MAFLTFCFTVLLIAYLIKQFLKSVKFTSRFDKLPGPRPRLPFLGNAHWVIDINLFRKPLNDFLIEKVENLTTIYANNGYAIFISMNRIYLVAFKPQLAMQIFTKVHNKLSDLSDLKQWFGDSLFANDFNEWKTKRKLLNPCFKSSVLKNHISSVNDILDAFIDNLGKYTTHEYFDVKPLIYDLNLSTLIATQIGISSNKISDSCRSYVENVEKTQNLFIQMLVNPLHIIPFVYYKTRTGRSLKQMYHDLKQFGRTLITSRKQETKDLIDTTMNTSFLDQLLKLQKSGANMTDEDIQSEMDTFIAAGFETSATTLIWVIFAVANNPEIQETLRNELRIVIGEDKQRPLTKEDLSSLIYTECVIKETLRLFPPVHTIVREAERDFYFDGHKYPKNTAVFLLLFKSQRDKDTFVNPDDFIPERFLDPKMNAELHAFAAGSRDCIGRQLAMNNMKMFIAKLFLNFDVTAKHRMNEVKRNYLGVLRPESELLINVRKIN